MPRILIVGGGYAGFYTALKLEKWLRKGEAEVVLVDPLPYMTYQPFLPEVAAGSIEPRHAVVSHRRHLRSTRVITAKVSGVNHASKTATIEPEVGEPPVVSRSTTQKVRSRRGRPSSSKLRWLSHRAPARLLLMGTTLERCADNAATTRGRPPPQH